MDAIVWVIQEGNHDYSKAEKYGTVQFITKAELRSTPGSAQTEQVHEDIARFLKQYAPGIDYIVPTGNPVLVTLIGMYLETETDHKYLKYDNRQLDYVLYTISKTRGGLLS